jgi:hypothetical protein
MTAGRAPGGPCPSGGRGDDADRGAVTVEAALALGTLVVLLALALGAMAAVTDSLRCVDAARELARLAARGEPDRGRSVAARLAPPGARLDLTRDGDTVSTEVSAELLSPLPLRIGGRAVAAVEPGVEGP